MVTMMKISQEFEVSQDIYFPCFLCIFLVLFLLLTVGKTLRETSYMVMSIVLLATCVVVHTHIVTFHLVYITNRFQ